MEEQNWQWEKPQRGSETEQALERQREWKGWVGGGGGTGGVGGGAPLAG